MNISELIASLEATKSQYGDLLVKAAPLVVEPGDRTTYYEHGAVCFIPDEFGLRAPLQGQHESTGENHGN